MLFDEFSKWYSFMNEQDTDEEMDMADEMDIFDESDELDEKTEITTQKNLDSVYTSQFVDIDEISQRFSEEIKSGNVA
ncbi:1405_t:CDS:2, partial [Gigaspora rosea]